jgi:CBS domain-containing protein
MRCLDIMKGDISCVTPQDTVQAAARLMRHDNVGFLPVCDVSNEVLGTITDRDLTIRILADARSATTPIADVMTAEVIACRPDDDLRKAEKLMSKHQKSRIMCIDTDGRLVGVISLSDIAQKDEAGPVAKTMREVSVREARV